MRFFSTELHKIYLDWTRTQPGLAFADFFSLFDNIMRRPEEYGFNKEYLKVGCIKEKCDANVREYIWFDDVRRGRSSDSRGFTGLTVCGSRAVPPHDLRPLPHGRRMPQSARQGPPTAVVVNEQRRKGGLYEFFLSL